MDPINGTTTSQCLETSPCSKDTFRRHRCMNIPAHWMTWDCWWNIMAPAWSHCLGGPYFLRKKHNPKNPDMKYSYLPRKLCLGPWIRSFDSFGSHKWDFCGYIINLAMVLIILSSWRWWWYVIDSLYPKMHCLHSVVIICYHHFLQHA